MLTLKLISEETERVIKGLEKKHFEDARKTIENVLIIDRHRRDAQQKLDKNKQQANLLAKDIGMLMKTGRKEQAEVVKAQVAELKTFDKKLQEEMDNAQKKMTDILLTIPNIPNDKVPDGKDANDNVVVKEGGEKPVLPENALCHWDLCKKYNLVDFDLGVKITGAGFPIYIGKMARLQRALEAFFLDEARKSGYLEVQPPFVVNEASGYGTGQLPDKEGQMYHANLDNLYLIPTAEVPVTNIFRDTILEEKELPHVEGLCKKLELPYHILLLCGGDQSFTSSICYDFEVWSAAQKRWLEVSSVSNFESYQANRLHCRYRRFDNKKIELCHTLNGSALALPRIVATILENNQTPEGIRVPKVLIPYCGFDLIDDKNFG